MHAFTNAFRKCHTLDSRADLFLSLLLSRALLGALFSRVSISLFLFHRLLADRGKETHSYRRPKLAAAVTIPVPVL